MVPGQSQNDGYYQHEDSSAAVPELQTQQQSWNQDPELGSWFNHDGRPCLSDQQIVPASTVPQIDESTWSREPELGWCTVLSICC